MDFDAIKREQVNSLTEGYDPVRLIKEMKKHPGLYDLSRPADREEKLAMWKEIGAAMYPDWDQCNKATAYDRVLQLQRKWRSLRDAYNREIRGRRTGVRPNKRIYRYFKLMSFLGGFEGTIESDEDDLPDYSESNDPLTSRKPTPKPKKKRITKPERQSTDSDLDTCEPIEEMPVYSVATVEENDDSDKLFLMSFLPEIRQLPVHIKMWARAQIAQVMQEAVACHYNNTMPGSRHGERNRDGSELS